MVFRLNLQIRTHLPTLTKNNPTEQPACEIRQVGIREVLVTFFF